MKFISVCDLVVSLLLKCFTILNYFKWISTHYVTRWLAHSILMKQTDLFGRGCYFLLRNGLLWRQGRDSFGTIFFFPLNDSTRLYLNRSLLFADGRMMILYSDVYRVDCLVVSIVFFLFINLGKAFMKFCEFSLLRYTYSFLVSTIIFSRRLLS